MHVQMPGLQKRETQAYLSKYPWSTNRIKFLARECALPCKSPSMMNRSPTVAKRRTTNGAIRSSFQPGADFIVRAVEPAACKFDASVNISTPQSSTGRAAVRVRINGVST